MTEWCKDAYLCTNPKKTIVIPFTRRPKLSLTEPIVSGLTIDFTKEVKKLGFVVDSKLL
jgi:hypothetical protein